MGSSHNVNAGVASEVSLLKLVIYGDEHTGVEGLVSKVDKHEVRIDKVEKNSADILSRIEGGITTLKWICAVAVGFFTILASAVEISRAFK